MYLVLMILDPGLLDLKPKHTYLRHFWFQSSVDPENTTNVNLMMPTYHKLLWSDKVDAEKTMSAIVTKPTNHKLLWTDKMDAENITDENVMMLTYHNLWWVDRKHAGAAAATVIVLDSSSQHHDGTAAFESALTYHLHSWSNEVCADDNKTGVISHRASNKDNEYTDGSGDIGVSGSKVFETIWWDLRFSKFPLFQLSGMVEWQNAIQKKTKKRKNKTRFSALSAAAARSHSARSQRGSDQ